MKKAVTQWFRKCGRVPDAARLWNQSYCVSDERVHHFIANTTLKNAYSQKSANIDDTLI